MEQKNRWANVWSYYYLKNWLILQREELMSIDKKYKTYDQQRNPVAYEAISVYH